jgi:hypothetical protein
MPQAPVKVLNFIVGLGEKGKSYVQEYEGDDVSDVGIGGIGDLDFSVRLEWIARVAEK